MARQWKPEHDALVDRIATSGDYHDADQIIGEALRLLEEQGRRRQWLRTELAIGEEQERRGELVEYTPDFMDRRMKEADERSRHGLPIKDAVKP